MKVEWDVSKNQANFNKHGLKFEDVFTVFESEMVAFEDDRKDYGEKRYISLGLLAGRVIVIVHTVRLDNIRIISMRKANEREKKIYYERLKKN
jgi:uncharacterized protein